MPTPPLLPLFLVLLALLPSADCQSQPYFSSPKDLYISDDNFSSIISFPHQKHPLPLAILFTNSHCQDCQLYDDQMSALIDSLTINVYRCELSLSPQLQDTFRIKRFPMLHFVINQPNFMSSMSYAFYHNHRPVTLEDALSIQDKFKHYQNPWKDGLQEVQQTGKGSYIMVNLERLKFIQQMDKLYYSIKLTQQYGLNPLFRNLPKLAYFNTTQEYLRALQQQETPSQEYSKCSFFVQNDRSCHQPSSQAEVQQMFTTLNFLTVLQFTQYHYKAFVQAGLDRHVFVVVLDSIYARRESLQLISMFESILRGAYFRKRAVVFWMQTQINPDKLLQLGFKATDKAPLLAKMDLQNPKKELFRPTKTAKFERKQVVAFMRRTIQKYEKSVEEEWNYDILRESIRKNGLEKRLTVVEPSRQSPDSNRLSNTEQESGNSFVLVVEPCREEEDPNECFSESLLSFNYFIKRIERFSPSSISARKVAFSGYVCNGIILERGLAMQMEGRCLVVTTETTVRGDRVEEGKMDMIRKAFDLPEQFWVNEDDYADLGETADRLVEWKQVQITL